MRHDSANPSAAQLAAAVSAGQLPGPPPEGPSNLNCALRLADLGWSIIPLCHPSHAGHYPPGHCRDCNRPGKRPVFRWLSHQDIPASDADIRDWWTRNPEYNVGIVTGLVSGIVMVDIDTDDGLSHWDAMFCDMPPRTWEFGTGRGGKRIVFAWPYADAPRGRPFRGLEGHLDFLGEGHYTVAPPSLHQSGRRYHWLQGGPGSGMPLADVPASLVQAFMHPPAESRGPVGGGENPVTYPLAEAPDKDWSRAVHWARGFEPAISGRGGQAVLWKLACSLIHAHKLHPDDAAYVMLAEWNHRCQPPWEESEIRRTTARAMQHGTFNPIKERPMTKQPQTTTTAPKTAPSAADRHDDDVPWVSGETVSESSYDWFMPPYIPRGVASFLVGVPGVGKSTFQAYLASKARRTLILPGEEDISRSLLPRLEAAGVPRKSWDFMEPHENWRFPDCLQRFTSMIAKAGFDLIIADPIDDYLSRGFDENNSQAIRDLLNGLRRMCEETHVTMICCRHPGKAVENVMVGSRAWRSVPRVIVEMKLDSNVPPRRIIQHYKNSLGPKAPERYYEVASRDGRPPVFELGELVSPAAKTADADPADNLERSAIEEACCFLRMVLADGPMDNKDVYKLAEEHRVSTRTLQRAALKLEVTKDRKERGKAHRCLWSLPPAKPSQD